LSFPFPSRHQECLVPVRQPSYAAAHQKRVSLLQQSFITLLSPALFFFLFFSPGKEHQRTDHPPSVILPHNNFMLPSRRILVPFSNRLFSCIIALKAHSACFSQFSLSLPFCTPFSLRPPQLSRPCPHLSRFHAWTPDILTVLSPESPPTSSGAFVNRPV